MKARAIVLCAALFAACGAAAQEGRTFNPIARPAARPVLPDGAVRVTPPRPVSRERIESAVGKVAQAWNERRIEKVLAPGFQRGRELMDAIQTKVPRDASLRVTAIQSWNVIDQYRQGGVVVSQVNVTVRTQVEFNDPASGQQVRDGINHYVLTLKDKEGP